MPATPVAQVGKLPYSGPDSALLSPSVAQCSNAGQTYWLHATGWALSHSRQDHLMTRLTLSLLGRFAVAVDDAPVAGFDTDKTRALLAYLAVEAAHPHSREALAAL